MSITKKPARTAPPRRVRRPAAAAREHVLDAAERILVAQGPAGLKLSDVAREAKVTNGNVLHHFGTIEGVQHALMERIVRRVTDRAIAIAETDMAPPERMRLAIDALFTALGDPATARLAAWLTLVHDEERMNEVRDAIGRALNAAYRAERKEKRRSRDEIDAFAITSIMLAFASGLYGPVLSEFFGRDPGYAREAALRVLLTAAERET